MNEKVLLFIGGFIFAVVTARKAYAPNRDNQLGTPPIPQPNLANRECPEGQYKDSIVCTMGMDAGSLACAEESKRLGGFRCVEYNRPQSNSPSDLSFLRPQSQNDCSLGTYFKENECLTSDQIIDRRNPQSQEVCPESVELGCGMPGPGRLCTNQMRRGTPFIQDCISAGLTRKMSRPV